MEKTYRKKETFQALEWDESKSTLDKIGCRMLSCEGHSDRPDEMKALKIESGFNESAYVSKGDFIVKDERGNFEVLQPDYFNSLYEPTPPTEQGDTPERASEEAEIDELWKRFSFETETLDDEEEFTGNQIGLMTKPEFKLAIEALTHRQPQREEERNYKWEVIALREALQYLVDTKDRKDSIGKDSIYEQRKSMGWMKARNLLDSIPHPNPETDKE